MAGTSNSITTHNVLNGVLNADNVISGLVNTAFNPAYALVTQAGAQIVLFINSSDYKMYAQLKDKSGNLIYTSNIIDLPLETMVVDGRYDSGTKKLILVLDNGNEIEVPLGALISGLVNENDLVANYYDKDEIDVLLDGYWTKIELTQEDIDNWNAKQEYLNQGDGIEISADTILKGNTSQATTTGKNLFNYIDNLQTPYRGLTSTINSDGSITTTGVPQYNYTSIIGYDITSQLENGQEYTLSQNTKQADKLYLQINIVDLNGGATQYASLSKLTSVSFTANTTNKKYIMNLQTGPTANWGSSSLTITNYYQLEKGSSATSFEPYVGGIPSPNPNYPQDIHVVSGDNSINVTGKNLFTLKNISNATALGIERTINNSELKLNGTSSEIGPIIGRQTAKITLLAGTYSILVQRKSGTVTPNGKYTAFYFRKPNGTEITAVNVNNFRADDYSFKTTFVLSEATELYVELYCSGAGYTLDNLTLQFQIEKGSTATTYEAYQGNTYPINLPVENLFDKNNTNIFNGFTNTTSHKLEANNNARTICFPCQSSTTYTISKTLSARFIVCETSSATISANIPTTTIEANPQAVSITGTTKSDTKYLLIFYYLSTADTLTEQQILDSIQIEVGSKANSYTPYGTTPIELCKIGTYQDSIVKDNGKWYLHKEIGKIVLDGTNVAFTGKSGSSNNNQFYTNAISNIKKPSNNSTETKTYSSHFSSTYANYLYLNNALGLAIDIVGQINCGFKLGGNITTYAQANTWLQSNNVKVNYPLATPTNTEITDSTLISQLNALIIGFSNNWVENVSQTNADLLFEIEYDNKNLTISASSNLVRNTDYATSNTGGVIKIGYHNFNISEGRPYVTTTSYADYQNLGNDAFIGKGTLENVITGKGLVSNTDYANNNTGGVVKVQDILGLGIGSTGNLFATTKSYSTYQTLADGLVIGKGTLENVLNAKIGNIQTLLDNLNNGNGVE